MMAKITKSHSRGQQAPATPTRKAGRAHALPWPVPATPWRTALARPRAACRPLRGRRYQYRCMPMPQVQTRALLATVTPTRKRGAHALCHACCWRRALPMKTSFSPFTPPKPLTWVQGHLGRVTKDGRKARFPCAQSTPPPTPAPLAGAFPPPPPRGNAGDKSERVTF